MEDSSSMNSSSFAGHPNYIQTAGKFQPEGSKTVQNTILWKAMGSYINQTEESQRRDNQQMDMIPWQSVNCNIGEMQVSTTLQRHIVGQNAK